MQQRRPLQPNKYWTTSTSWWAHVLCYELRISCCTVLPHRVKNQCQRNSYQVRKSKIYFSMKLSKMLYFNSTNSNENIFWIDSHIAHTHKNVQIVQKLLKKQKQNKIITIKHNLTIKHYTNGRINQVIFCDFVLRSCVEILVFEFKNNNHINSCPIENVVVQNCSQMTLSTLVLASYLLAVWWYFSSIAVVHSMCSFLFEVTSFSIFFNSSSIKTCIFPVRKKKLNVSRRLWWFGSLKFACQESKNEIEMLVILQKFIS